MALRRLVYRLLGGMAVMLAALVVTFLVLRLLPADPAAFLATGPGMGPQEVAALRAHLGLDETLPRQLWHLLVAVLHGDLGVSYTTGQPVVRDLGQRLPASLLLTLTGGGLAVLVGIPLGLFAALKPGSWFDRLSRGIAVTGAAVPSFVVGLLLIAVFYGVLGWVAAPVGEVDPLAPTLISRLGHLILPSTTMAIFALAPVVRITRAALLPVLASDALLMARALGLSPTVILWHYALQNAAVPILSATTTLLATLVSANVVVETVFSWPGIGTYALNAALNADYAALEGFVLLMAGVFTGITLIIDTVTEGLDPRMRS